MLAYLCGHGIVAFAMPPQYQLGLLFEVLEIGHVGLHDEIVGGHGPSAMCRCSYMRRSQYPRAYPWLSIENAASGPR